MNWGRKKFDWRSLREREEKEEASKLLCCTGRREDVRGCVLAVGGGRCATDQCLFQDLSFSGLALLLSLVCL